MQQGGGQPRSVAETAPAAASARLDLELSVLVALVPIATIGTELALHGPHLARWGFPMAIGLVAASALAAVVVWIRWLGDRKPNVALTAAACTAWSIGQLAVTLQSSITGRDATGSPAQLGYVAFAVISAGALIWRFRQHSTIRRLALMGDAALFTFAVFYTSWELWLRAGITEAPRWASVWMVAVPFAVLAVGALSFIMFLQERSVTLALAAVACALLYSSGVIEATDRSPRFGPRCVVAWAASLLAFGVMAWISRRRSRPYLEPLARPSLARVAAVYAPTMVALVVAVLSHLVWRRPVHVGTTVIALGFCVALVTNQVGRAFETRTYAGQLVGSLHELATAQHQLRSLLDDLPQAVLVLDREGYVRESNRVSWQLTGRSVDELNSLHFADLLTGDQLDRVLEMWERAQGSATEDDFPTSVIISLAPPANPSILLEVDVILPLRDPDRVVVSLRDVTRALQEREALDIVRERFRLAFHGGPTGMGLATAPEGVLVDANQSFAAMLGMTVDDLVGRTVREITHPDDWRSNEVFLERSSERAIDSYQMEKRYLRADGSVMWARTWVSVLDGTDGDRLTIAHVVDITEQRRAAEQLRWAATHDELTRLPNRARFTAELTERLASAPLGTTAVLFIDLDNFKVINDSLGHATGDQLLRGMTERLRGVLRGRDMLSRFGGDEFVVLLSDCTADSSPRVMAERLLAEISRPLSIDGVELFVTASIGIVTSSSDRTTASDLLRDADAAMYRAKARGRNCVEVFAPGAHDATVLALRTSGELRRGIERDEIVPYFQPIVDLSSGVLTGFEVLARWRHPDRGLLGADQFLPMAEETGLINDVGAAVLRSSLVQLGMWRDRLPGFEHLTIAVNLSGRQLLSSDLVGLVGDALAEAGVPAGQLWLEITETALMTDVKAASVALRELRSMGLHLSVDDFGTGYSSLTYLKRFPVEAIKIDRSFVNGLGIDVEDSTIVEAVVNLGHSLGLTVVAEGVETPLQLSRLRELGCDKAQGYLFGRPRPAEIIEAERTVG
jgi:diguanylate cyclase (GGDEF)-like protein/PAS domain S-box-containing protein